MDELMRRIEKLKEEVSSIEVFQAAKYPDSIFNALDDVFVFCQMELDNENSMTTKEFAQEILDLIDRHLSEFKE